jgi:hypothetical protein
MAQWSAESPDGEPLGEFCSKSAMFGAMLDLLGESGSFRAVSSQGASYVYEITKYGYHATAKDVPESLRRTGRRR